jgi:hypothetical protein
MLKMLALSFAFDKRLRTRGLVAVSSASSSPSSLVLAFFCCRICGSSSVATPFRSGFAGIAARGAAGGGTGTAVIVSVSGITQRSLHLPTIATTWLVLLHLVLLQSNTNNTKTLQALELTQPHGRQDPSHKMNTSHCQRPRSVFPRSIRAPGRALHPLCSPSYTSSKQRLEG